MSDVTLALEAIDRGEPQAAAKLLPLVYEELRRIAGGRMVRENSGQTLQATALVHEAYLRLIVLPLRNVGKEPVFANRRHFFNAAAAAMRRILIEKARRKKSAKHGGALQRIEWKEDLVAHQTPEEWLRLDEALKRLTEAEPLKAELVQLRFFAGLSMAEIAASLGISLATAERHWKFARLWLYTELNGEPVPPTPAPPENAAKSATEKKSSH